jgi:hypothetical protein
MKLFDLFKKKTKTSEIKIINFNEIYSFVLQKREDFKKKEKNLAENINEKLFLLINELSKNIEVLKDYNLKDKKIEERIMLIVKDNKNLYSNYAKNLILELKSFEIQGLESIYKLEQIITKFLNKSELSFQKSTIIIGKELETIKENIKKFIHESNKEIEQNLEWINNKKIIENIEKNYNEIIKNNEIIKDIEKNISGIINKINNNKNEFSRIENEISQIKKEDKYLYEIKKLKEIVDKKISFKQELTDFRQMFDFKELSRMYHKDSKIMSLINNYKDDFNFINSSNFNIIIDLTNDKEKILAEKQKILDKLNNLKIEEENLNLEDSDKISKLEKNNLAILEIINDFNNELDIEQKKKYKLLGQNNERLLIIKQELKKMNLKL